MVEPFLQNQRRQIAEFQSTIPEKKKGCKIAYVFYTIFDAVDQVRANQGLPPLHPGAPAQMPSFHFAPTGIGIEIELGKQMVEIDHRIDIGHPCYPRESTSVLVENINDLPDDHTT